MRRMLVGTLLLLAVAAAGCSDSGEESIDHECGDVGDEYGGGVQREHCPDELDYHDPDPETGASPAG
ncbi:MAG TPA: hypothetical protein VM582_02300 [Candidatus Thermoplasmatota archaeon]|nr:hypothetical protein [Candidatus Thermoplasmatota archaeon]